MAKPYVYTPYKESEDVVNRRGKMDTATSSANNFWNKGYSVGAGGYGGQISYLDNQYKNTLKSAPSQNYKYNNQKAYNKALNNILNRKAFQYDLSNDQLFQQAKENYQAMGQAAMADTIGQASAMTGGYGNSYATSAGAQAYNNYLQQLNNSIGDYYAMALNAYNAENDRLNNAFGAVSQDRATDFNEWQGDWNVTNSLLNHYGGRLDNLYSLDNSAWSQKGKGLTDMANIYSDQFGTALSNDISIHNANESGKQAQSDSELKNEQYQHEKDNDAWEQNFRKQQFEYQKGKDKLDYSLELAKAGAKTPETNDKTLYSLKEKIDEYKKKLDKDNSLSGNIPGTNNSKRDQLLAQYVERLLMNYKGLDRESQKSLYQYAGL